MTDLATPPVDDDRATIVIADDDEDVVRALADLIDGHPGLRVVGTALDGFAAASLARATQPELVVLDVNMPGGAIEGLHAVQAAAPKTSVIFYTAQADRRTRRRLMDAGAAAVFAKGEAVDLMASFRAIADNGRLL